MKHPVAIQLLATAAALALFAGCASHAPTNVGPQVATADDVSVSPPTQPPPPNQRDIIPISPGPRTLWYFLPGRWDWRGKWVWVPGNWRPRPHPGDIWIQGKWVAQDNIYVWQKGHWRSGAPSDEE
jgi:hypothetical protein